MFVFVFVIVYAVMFAKKNSAYLDSILFLRSQIFMYHCTVSLHCII